MVASAAVQQALRGVVDPCSMMSGTAVDIVDMGIVRTIGTQGRRVSIELQPTDGTCYFSFHLAQRAKEAVEALPEVDEVDVQLVAKELWTPDKIAPDARERLAEARAQRRVMLQVEPWALRANQNQPGGDDAGSGRTDDEHCVTVPGGEIAWRERSGRSDTLVMLHALSSTAASWRRVIRALPSDVRTIAPDLRGRGGTRLAGGGGLDAHVADLETLLDALDLDRVVLAGHSFGAIVAAAAARAMPRRIRALVLVDGGPRPPHTALAAADGAAGRYTTTWPTQEDFLGALRDSYAWRDVWSPELAEELRAELRSTSGGWQLRGEAGTVTDDVASMRSLSAQGEEPPQCPTSAVRAGQGVLGPDDLVLGAPEVALLQERWAARIVTLDGARHSSMLHTHAEAIADICATAMNQAGIAAQTAGNESEARR